MERTLGLSELAHYWAERLRLGELAGQDALVVVGGPAGLLGRHFALDRRAGRISLGRGTQTQARAASDPILLDSAFVSSPHAVLEAVPEGWLLVDLQSSNHTYVGTVRVERQHLVYGDEVRLGDVVLLYISAGPERLPSHVVDAVSGLLTARVFEAEATRLAELAGAGELFLLLLRCPGLREALAEQAAGGLAELPGELGAALLAGLDDTMLGRLQADLFAAAWRGEVSEAAARAERARLALAALVGARGLPPPRAVLCRRQGPTLRVPHLLAAGLAELEQAGPLLVHADLNEQRPLLGEPQLVSLLLAEPELTLLLLGLADEDGLRHRLGHEQLLACRWRLRRLGGGVATNASLVGMLGERILLFGCADPAEAARLGDELRRSFQSELAAVPALAGETLKAVLVAPEERSQVRRGRDLRSLLLEAVEGARLAAAERLEADALPAPLAAPYALVFSLSSETGRLRAILQAAETAARFVTCCGLAALARWGGAESQARIRPLLGRSGRPCLSLGEWVALLRELQPELGKIDEPLGRLLGGVMAGVQGQAPLAHLLERSLLPARNDFAHGGVTVSEQGEQGRVRALLGELHELLRALRPLESAQLLAVVETRPRRGGAIRASVRLLSGARENFEIREVDLRCGPEPLFPGSVYLCSEDYREALELQPLVRLQPCPRCDRDEIFIAEGLPPAGSRLELRAISTGHPLRWRPTLEEVPEPWLRLSAGGSGAGGGAGGGGRAAAAPAGVGRGPRRRRRRRELAPLARGEGRFPQAIVAAGVDLHLGQATGSLEV